MAGIEEKMDTYQVPIDLPDGSKIKIELEATGEPTQDDVYRFLQTEYEKDPTSELGKLHEISLGERFKYQETPDDAAQFKLSNEDGTKRTEYDVNDERLRNVLNTVTFEYGDELEAFARSKFGDADYDKTVEQLRKQQGQYRIDKPAEAILTSIATGLVTGTAAVKLLQKSPMAYNFILGNPNAPLAKRILQQSRTGAIAGGITGSGAAEDTEAIPGTAAYYAGMGSVIPSVLIGGGAATGKIKQMISNVLRNSGIKEGDPKKEAFEYIASTLANQGKTAQQIEEEIARAKKLGVDDYQIGEMTSGTRQLSKQAFTVPSESNDIIEDVLGQRKDDMTNIIENSIIKKLKINKADFDDQYVFDLSQRQANKARQVYPEAESKTINRSAFQTDIGGGKKINMLDTDLAKQAYNRYRSEAMQRLRPEQIPTYEELMKMDEIPTEFLVKIKRGIRSLVDDQVDTTTGKYKSQYGKQLNNDLKDFDEVIRKNNPQYAKANDEFADSQKLKEIYEQGFDYQKLRSGEFERYVKSLDDDQLEAFKIGLANKIKDLAETAGTQDFANKVFKNERLKKALKNIFKDDKEYAEFNELIELAGKRKKTAQQLLGGSQTQPLTKQSEIFEQITEKGGINTVLNFLKQNFGMPPAVAENIKKQLINASPAEQKAIIKSIIENQKKAARNEQIKKFAKGGAISQAKNAPQITEGLLFGQGDRETEDPFAGIL